MAAAPAPWSQLVVDGGAWVIDLSRPFDLSVRVRFGDGAPRPFGLPAARQEPVRVGGFVGATALGGSCNCRVLTLTPHGDGTHTEGVGHLVDDDIAAVDAVALGLVPCLIISVTPRALGDTDDDVSGNHAREDLVVAAFDLEDALNAHARAGLVAHAVVIRTAAGAIRRAAGSFGENPPYLTVSAAALLRARGVDHVLVDLPSLDRADDGGLLSAHRAFFDVAAGATRLGAPPPRRSVTELCAVDDEVNDGWYALNLQVAPLHTDAAPSRPIVFPLLPVSPPKVSP